MPIPAWLAQALAVDYSRLLPLRALEKRFGWVTPEFARVLARWPDVFECDDRRVSLALSLNTAQSRTAAFDRVAQALRAEGLLRTWRDERYDVFDESSGEPLMTIERGAIKRFGIRGRAAHLNGIVETRDGLKMWVATRSMGKSTDPGKLDNLVGGGIPAGSDAWETLLRECREEAGIPPQLAHQARPRELVPFDYQVPEGLDSNEVQAFDLPLPPDFVPVNQDGEVAEFALLPLYEVRELLEIPHRFTVDAAIVAWACLERWLGGER